MKLKLDALRAFLPLKKPFSNLLIISGMVLTFCGTKKLIEVVKPDVLRLIHVPVYALRDDCSLSPDFSIPWYDWWLESPV